MDKQYAIVVNYDTGDSYSQQPDQETEVWDNADQEIAKINAQRIKQQQEVYQAVYDQEYNWNTKHKKREDVPGFSLPFVVPEDSNNGIHGWYVMLLDDERVEHRVHTGEWQGYFETYNYVEVRGRNYRP